MTIKKLLIANCVLLLILIGVSIFLSIPALFQPQPNNNQRGLSESSPSVHIFEPVPLLNGPHLRNAMIKADASAAGNKSIAKVEFYVDDVLLPNGTDTEAPFECEYECTDRFGESRKISAVVYDSDGLEGRTSVDLKFFNGVEKTPMPTERYAFTSDVVNEKIYVIGGHDHKMKVVEEYDPATDQWATKSAPKFGHAVHASCVIDNIIYVFGGASSTEWITNVEAYDPATDTWTTKAPIPAELGASIGLNCAATANGKAYLMGGMANPEPAKVAEYDPVADSWSMTESFKREYNAEGLTVDNTIYFLGGCPFRSMNHCDDPSDSLQIYDPIKDAWIEKSPMPIPHTGHSATVHNGKIYVMGGTPHNHEQANRDFEVYDPSTDTWSILPGLPRDLLNSGCNSANGKIYIIGPKHTYEYTAD